MPRRKSKKQPEPEPESVQEPASEPEEEQEEQQESCAQCEEKTKQLKAETKLRNELDNKVVRLEKQLDRKNKSMKTQKEKYENQLKLCEKKNTIESDAEVKELTAKLESLTEQNKELTVKLNDEALAAELEAARQTNEELRAQLKAALEKADPSSVQLKTSGQTANPFSIAKMSDASLNAVAIYKIAKKGKENTYIKVDCRFPKVKSMGGRLTRLYGTEVKEVLVVKCHPNVCGIWEKTIRQLRLKTSPDTKNQTTTFTLDVPEEDFCRAVRSGYSVCL